MRPSSIVRAFVSLLGPALAAQLAPVPGPAALPAPAEVLNALSVRTATVQELTLPQSGWDTFQVPVSLDGQTRTLTLAPRSVLSRDFRLMVTDATGTHAVPTPQETTYAGSVVEVPGSSVAASLRNGQLEAHIRLPDGRWTIQELTDAITFAPRALHVVYRNADVLQTAGSCGVATRHQHDAERPTGGGAGPAEVRVCEIALDCDEAFYGRFFRNFQNTFDAALNIINAVDAIYVNEVEIRYVVTRIFVRTGQLYVTGPDLGCGTTAGLLQEFENHWTINHWDVTRDVAHLFTGSGIGIGVIGCANLSTICTGSAYGVSRAYLVNAAQNIGLVAHELGHNWGANHCSGSDCHIMCASLGGCSGIVNAFSAGEKAEIYSHRNSRWCLVQKNEVEPNTAIYYRLYNAQAQASRSLDVINDGTNTRLNMQPSGAFTGQYWRFTPVAGVPGTYRISCQWRGPNLPIDVVGSGAETNAVVLSPIGAFSGQYWRITEVAEWPGTVSFSSIYRGRQLVMSGPATSRAWLEPYGPLPYQAWTMQPEFSVDPATATPFGAGCRGRGGVPGIRLTGGSLPWINQTMTGEVTNVPANAAALLIIGSRLPTPIDLAVAQSPGCLLRLALDFQMQLPVAAGAGTFSLQLPNVLPLVGTTLPIQGAVFDPAHGPTDPLFAMSNGLDLRFGLQ
jgi:hypothetical protein